MIVDQLIFSKHLEEGENIVYAVHKHWIEVVKPIAELAFVGFLLPWSLYLIGFNTSLFFWVAVSWSVLAYFRFLYVLIDWYSDAWLITNMSIIAIEWDGVFSNSSARIGFEDLEGAAYAIRGFWGTMLRFGDMTLRVISGTHQELKNVASPKRAELALMKHQEHYMSEKSMNESESLKQILSNLVAHHHRRGR